MSCFIGVSVQLPLHQQTYSQAISQMQDFIQQSSFVVELDDNLLVISSEPQQFCITKNPHYLHSNLQHILVSSAIDEQFVETVVQCLMILKQHFPHQIEIQMISELELIFNLKGKVQQEIPRRLIGHLKVLAQSVKKSGKLTLQQVNMLIDNIQAQFHKDYKQKIVSMSLKILSEANVDPKIWSSLSKQQIKVIDNIVNDPLYQKMGIEILQKIVRNNDSKMVTFSNQKQNLQPNENQQISQYGQLSRRKGQQLFPEFDPNPADYTKSLDTMTALFQLKQSINLSRISWLIDNIQQEKLSQEESRDRQLRQKKQKRMRKFDKRIKEVAQKFVNDHYSESTLLQIKKFAKSVADYETRRVEKLNWNGLIEQIFMKIQDKQKQIDKGQPIRTKLSTKR